MLANPALAAQHPELQQKANKARSKGSDIHTQASGVGVGLNYKP